MTVRWLTPIALLAVAACVQEEEPQPPSPFVEPSQALLDLADPSQDLSRLVIESDNCWYRLHRGPVETTYIPVRTRDGREICLPDEPEPGPEDGTPPS